MDHCPYNSSDCKRLYVNACCFVVSRNISFCTNFNIYNHQSPIPLTLVDDSKFSWPCLSEIFQRLSCFYQTMGGNFPKTDKNKIFISQQTYEWLKITVSSVTTGSSFFFYIKSDTFIQIFLGL